MPARRARSPSSMASALARKEPSKNANRPRSLCFAWYMAVSASDSSNWLSLPARLRPMPRLAWTGTARPSMAKGSPTDSMSRLATLVIDGEVTSSHTTTYSSPPERASVSPGRTLRSSLLGTMAVEPLGRRVPRDDDAVEGLRHDGVDGVPHDGCQPVEDPAQCHHQVRRALCLSSIL